MPESFLWIYTYIYLVFAVYHLPFSDSNRIQISLNLVEKPTVEFPVSLTELNLFGWISSKNKKKQTERPYRIKILKSTLVFTMISYFNPMWIIIFIRNNEDNNISYVFS